MRPIRFLPTSHESLKTAGDTATDRPLLPGGQLATGNLFTSYRFFENYRHSRAR